MRRFLKVLGLSTALAVGALQISDLPAKAQMSSNASPDLMMLELQVLQDEIVMGNREAYQLLQPSLIVIGRRFLSVDRALWKTKQNSYAAVAFMLSGGSGSVFQALADEGVTFNVDPNLFAGAMAYSQGNREAAKNLLLKVEALDLPTVIAGQVALSQAILLSQNEPEKSIKYFDLARLLMPGTLVEESALRREAPIVANLGDNKKYERLARRYLFQYQSSVFAKQFRDRLAQTISTEDYLSTESDWDKVMQLLNDYDPESQRIVLLKLGRAALSTGNTHFAVKAGEAVLASDGASIDQKAAAHLYHGAGLAPTREWRKGLNELIAVDEKLLRSVDRIMLHSAIITANMIRKWPSPVIEPASEFVPEMPLVGLDDKLLEPKTFEPFNETLASAEATLADAEF
ncbi:hypothetical protein [Polycladidibacter stylochi]|uniref:hypothetical protein n=1 Tax=Polycladidibacter stylochi TaxID=1807766 RepID=UPI0008328284|nr:hypothetical protein [Pseudovibrio stylochi]